jgi:hypothetical protein
MAIAPEGITPQEGEQVLRLWDRYGSQGRAQFQRCALKQRQ